MILSEVKDYSQILKGLGLIKNKARESKMRLLTNFFPEQKSQNQWIEDRRLKIAVSEHSMILVLADDYADRLFYVSSEAINLTTMIESVHENSAKPIVIEHITNRGGFELDAVSKSRVLLRYSRSGVLQYITPKQKSVETAGTDDILRIRKLLLEHFDKITDRIPSISEILSLGSKGGVIEVKENEEIKGFLIYELTGQSIHLRYWWTNPLYRNQGIGSSLMACFFQAGKDTSRQYLWVDKDNDNAIGCYEHYGFSPDGLSDYIQVIINP